MVIDTIWHLFPICKLISIYTPVWTNNFPEWTIYNISVALKSLFLSSMPSLRREQDASDSFFSLKFWVFGNWNLHCFFQVIVSKLIVFFFKNNIIQFKKIQALLLQVKTIAYWFFSITENSFLCFQNQS